MSNAATHFCAWCNVSREMIQRSDSPRTPAGIISNNSQWTTEGKGKKKDAALYFNCSNIPLLYPAENAPIIHFVPPPELHLLLGITTHLFNQLAKENPEVAEKWLDEAGVQRFHGGSSFNGNGARKLLKMTDKLNALSPGLITYL